MHSTRRVSLGGGAIGAALVLLVASAAFAHEKGVITLSAKQAPAGSELVIRGAKLAKGGSVRLELRGALTTVSFGRVRTDTSGKFEQRVIVPPNTKPGEYKIAAVAPDGDVTAEADLVVIAAGIGAAPSEAHPGMHDMPGMGGTGGPHATAESMDVPVSTTPGGWFAIGAIIAVAAAGGALLVRGTGSAARTS